MIKQCLWQMLLPNQLDVEMETMHTRHSWSSSSILLSDRWGGVLPRFYTYAVLIDNQMITLLIGTKRMFTKGGGEITTHAIRST